MNKILSQIFLYLCVALFCASCDNDKTLHFAAVDGKLTQADASTSFTIAKAGKYTVVVAADANGYLTYSEVELQQVIKKSPL